MTSRTASILIMIGLLTTFGGVGGIENSVSDSDVFTAVIVSIVGLLVMYCGVSALRVSDYYDTY